MLWKRCGLPGYGMSMKSLWNPCVDSFSMALEIRWHLISNTNFRKEISRSGNLKGKTGHLSEFRNNSCIQPISEEYKDFLWCWLLNLSGRPISIAISCTSRFASCARLARYERVIATSFEFPRYVLLVNVISGLGILNVVPSNEHPQQTKSKSDITSCGRQPGCRWRCIKEVRHH